MPTIHQPPDKTTDRPPLPPPNWPLIDAALADMGLLPAALAGT